MHIWKLCAQTNFLYLQTSTLIALSGVILCLCSHPPFCHSMRTSWISCSGGLMYPSGYMEMNKQVQPIDIFWASGIYFAFLHQCHPRTLGCFPGTPWGFVHSSAGPLSHCKWTICAGGWCVGGVNRGVSKAQAVLPSPDGSSGCLLSRGDMHWLMSLLCEHTWTCSSWRALCGPCCTVEEWSLWRCKVHQRQRFALCSAGSASETGLRGSL